MWIVINALWIFHMTEETGHFAVLRRAFSSVSRDQRVQVVVIAFCFGALLEALAGFGTPVAICGIMLVGLGFPDQGRGRRPGRRHRARGLRGNRDPDHDAGADHRLAQARAQPDGGASTPLLALVVPFILVGMVGGRRGLRDAWPAALVAGGVFAALQFATSNYISTELTDIVASLGSAAALVALLRVWSPREAPDPESPVAGPCARPSPAAPRPTPRWSAAWPPTRDAR